MRAMRPSPACSNRIHEVGGWQLISGFFRPFHEADVVPAEHVAETCIHPLSWVVESIEIKVMQV